METYQTLMLAVATIETAKLATYSAEGDSPAWRKLLHARDYLRNQAAEILTWDSEAEA